MRIREDPRKSSQRKFKKKFVILVRILTSPHKENSRKKVCNICEDPHNPHKGLCEDARTFFLKKIATPGLPCNTCEDPHKYYKLFSRIFFAMTCEDPHNPHKAILCNICEDPHKDYKGAQGKLSFLEKTSSHPHKALCEDCEDPHKYYKLLFLEFSL